MAHQIFPGIPEQSGYAGKHTQAIQSYFNIKLQGVAQLIDAVVQTNSHVAPCAVLSAAGDRLNSSPMRRLPNSRPQHWAIRPQWHNCIWHFRAQAPVGAVTRMLALADPPVRT